MFKTIKSKILAITILMLAVLLAAFACYGIVFRMKTKQLMLQGYSFSIDKFAYEINEKIIDFENNSEDLALLGNLFYRTDRKPELTKQAVKSIFENYKLSLGGGIWFEPYVVNPKEKRHCYYIYRGKDNILRFDEKFASEEYDYHNQSWYKEIKNNVTPEHNIAWSLPYYEEIGSESMMITIGSGIYHNGKLIGISTVDWNVANVFNDLMEMKPIEHGFQMYAKRNTINGSFAMLGNLDRNYIIVTNDPYVDIVKIVGQKLESLSWYNPHLYEQTYIKYHEKKYVPFVKHLRDGLLLIICIPKSEMFPDVNKFSFMMLIILALLGILIPALLYFSLNQYIISPIEKLMKIAHKIGKGEDIQIKLDKPEEFAKLASTFDKMTKNLKSITKEREKINSELGIAKAIQSSSLPNIFPPFPNNKEFSIYASMEAAKEVGGDFYDFYFRDENNFMFLIADVSGKGIPAALFMMTGKTLINNMSQMNYEPKELIREINNRICATNKQGLFITMLAGIVDIKTGKMSLINCGHNQPLIKRKNGEYEYLSLESNMVLGIFENTEYEIYETQLNGGDILFTYTDGITEAINRDEEMFGENRLKDSLNSHKDIKDVQKISEEIKKDLENFTMEATQNDDITMLVFKFENGCNEKVFRADAIIENYKPFYSWLHNICDEWGINEEVSNMIDMCGEEIFANITFYAYPETNGTIEAKISKTNDEITLVFEDYGITYNPLDKPDPDITLPPEDRPLGGLGIYMVKQMAKDVIYERIDEKNILTVIFGI